jgi:AcrR family transcriptional regulator
MEQPAAPQHAPLTAADWVEAAFDFLADGGIDAVRIEPLAKRLKVSRGSFYWHFADRDALYEAMLRTWRQRASYTVYARVERTGEPARARLERILALPYSNPRSAKAAAIEFAIRLWARRDKRAHKAVRHIDRVRLDYFEQLMEQDGVAPEKRRSAAALFYAAMMAQALIATDEPSRFQRRLKDALLGPGSAS